jgi:dephospho-CoA kinase
MVNGKSCAGVVAIVGMCGAGKSLATGYLQKKGFGVVYFGGITMTELEKRGLSRNEINEKAVREELRNTYGKAAYAILSLPLIKQALEKGNVVLDGLYSWSEYKLLKEEFGELLTVVAVTADRKVRYSRLKNRKIRPLSGEEALKRDYSEIENIEKGGPIAMADYTAVNNSSQQELFSRLDEIIKGISRQM